MPQKSHVYNIEKAFPNTRALRNFNGIKGIIPANTCTCSIMNNSRPGGVRRLSTPNYSIYDILSDGQYVIR